MVGLVVSGNLIQLVFFWELTSLFSFLLIGYWHHNEAARSSARMALIVTATGGLCLMVGVLLLGKIVGSYDLDVVLAAAAEIKGSGYYLPVLVLILLGAFTKSAQFPFHFWLPHAMAAPTPVSAYLHSATMVKAGIFLLIRMWPVLAGTEQWYLIVGTAGLVTFVLTAAFVLMIRNRRGSLCGSCQSPPQAPLEKALFCQRKRPYVCGWAGICEVASWSDVSAKGKKLSSDLGRLSGLASGVVSRDYDLRAAKRSEFSATDRGGDYIEDGRSASPWMTLF